MSESSSPPAEAAAVVFLSSRASSSSSANCGDILDLGLGGSMVFVLAWYVVRRTACGNPS